MPLNDVAAEVESLVDFAPIIAAQAMLEEAELSAREGREDAREAERHHAAAKAAFGDMVDAAAAGQRVSRASVIAAHAEVEASSRWSSFAAAVARARTKPVEDAQTALADTHHRAWLPVFEHGVTLRIAAAAKADRAALRTAAKVATRPAMAEADAARRQAMDALRPAWDRANAFLALAQQNGVRSPDRFPGDRPAWPSSEERERRYWDKPLSAEEIDYADVA